MRILFFDTETTGFVLANRDFTDPLQPHMVQLGAKLVDFETRRTECSVNLISYADTWTIPQGAAEIHKITTEKSRAVGVPETLLACNLTGLIGKCDLIVGHNIQFDIKIARIAFARSYLPTKDLLSRKSICTMESSRDFAKLPPTERMLRAGRRGYKSPKLSEIYELLFDEALSGAHDAMVDVNATERVFFELLDMGEISL